MIAAVEFPNANTITLVQPTTMAITILMEYLLTSLLDDKLKFHSFKTQVAAEFLDWLEDRLFVLAKYRIET